MTTVQYLCIPWWIINILAKNAYIYYQWNWKVVNFKLSWLYVPDKNDEDSVLVTKLCQHRVNDK